MIISMRRSYKKWDVFYNEKRKHPSITIKDKDDKWVNVKLTHDYSESPYLIKLKKNPNKNDLEDSYVHTKLRIDNQRNKGDKYFNYKIALVDKIRINRYVKKNKKKS